MALQKVPFWTGARTVMLTYEPGLDTPPDVPPPPPPPPPPDFPEVGGDDEDIAPPPDRPGYAPDPIHGGGYEPIEPTRPPARDGRSNVGNMVLGGGFLFAFLVLVTSKGQGRR
ncbi:MAG TPA: hypothetical protein VMY40_14995 [Anaerolineae bacterium]|nr:hypothetical protein [Anaerolineae bacterium]